ncbi:hypothetical protein JW826_01940 [Candidatus Woesearchaeota archaeon]|nr:hypothetical protein [Candidatus Woesearchaeota archaeon]
MSGGEREKRKTLPNLISLIWTFDRAIDSGDDLGTFVGLTLLHSLADFRIRDGARVAQDIQYQEIKRVYAGFERIAPRIHSRDARALFDGYRLKVDELLQRFVKTPTDASSLGESILLMNILTSLSSAKGYYEDHLRRRGSRFVRAIEEAPMMTRPSDAMNRDYRLIKECFVGAREGPYAYGGRR